MIGTQEYIDRYKKGQLKGFKICNNHVKEAEPQKIAINHKKTNNINLGLDQRTFSYRGEADFDLNLEEESDVRLPFSRLPHNNDIYFFLAIRPISNGKN